jgi:UTP--glucose-1-phosphate uridylyltransferase
MGVRASVVVHIRGSSSMTLPKSSGIRRAVIPVAGLGTRLLPFTKVVPKEMLPIGNKPLIQHAVEEAVSSGISEVILVTAPGRLTTERHFSRDLPLERILERRGRKSDLELVRSLAGIAHIRTVCQDQPKGLGHAVGCVRRIVGNEPFAMILPDALIVSSAPCLRQLIDCYQEFPGSYVATREVDEEEFGRFGILKVSTVAGSSWGGRLQRVEGLVEKPAPAVAPSRFGIFGRYLFDPWIFECLDRTAPDHNGETQITDALALYCRKHPLYAFGFEGAHFDVGNKLGFLQAAVSAALTDHEIAVPFRRFLASLPVQ